MPRGKAAYNKTPKEIFGVTKKSSKTPKSPKMISSKPLRKKRVSSGQKFINAMS